MSRRDCDATQRRSSSCARFPRSHATLSAAWLGRLDRAGRLPRAMPSEHSPNRLRVCLAAHDKRRRLIDAIAHLIVDITARHEAQQAQEPAALAQVWARAPAVWEQVQVHTVAADLIKAVSIPQRPLAVLTLAAEALIQEQVVDLMTEPGALTLEP